jgi:hypothetical protein
MPSSVGEGIFFRAKNSESEKEDPLARDNYSYQRYQKELAKKKKKEEKLLRKQNAKKAREEGAAAPVSNEETPLS